MRALLPLLVDDPDVHEVYADDWLDGGGVRVNFVSSVDGAVAVHGLSKGLQTPGDNRLFAVLRDLADVVLVGAGTARAENYRPVVPDDRRRTVRARFGIAAALPVALVSHRLDLDLSRPLFDPPPGAPRAIVITHGRAPAARLRELADRADVIVAGDEQVDFVAALAALRDRGHVRILSEGGPSLFGQMLAEDVVDELCLSLTPLLAGTGAGRITAGAPLPVDVTPRLALTGLLEEDGALFLRYRVLSRPPSNPHLATPGTGSA
jgi:riboflavin biosynthesis pyrimidine reductase